MEDYSGSNPFSVSNPRSPGCSLPACLATLMPWAGPACQAPFPALSPQPVFRVLIVKHHSYAALPSSRTTSGSLWLMPLHPNAFLWLPIPIIISMSVSAFLITCWDWKRNTWAWTWPNNPTVQKYIQWILTRTQTLKYPSLPPQGHQKCAIYTGCTYMVFLL